MSAGVLGGPFEVVKGSDLDEHISPVFYGNGKRIRYIKCKNDCSACANT